MSEVRSEGVQREFLSERKGTVIPCRVTEDRKGAGTNSGESGARNLEAESIRSRAESTGGRVKLKTVTEIRRSSARDTFIAENVYLVLNSLWNWESVERLKKRSDMVSFTLLNHLMATLNLSLSTSPPPPKSQTQARTASKSNGKELTSLLEVNEITLLSGLKSTDCCSTITIRLTVIDRKYMSALERSERESR